MSLFMFSDVRFMQCVFACSKLLSETSPSILAKMCMCSATYCCRFYVRISLQPMVATQLIPRCPISKVTVLIEEVAHVRIIILFTKRKWFS